MPRIMKVNPTFAGTYATVKKILGNDTQFIKIILLYGIVVSFCSLGIPVSIQALVNTISFINLSQPLIILSLILLSVMFIFAFFHALQVYMLELFHRKIFSRLGSEITIRLFYTQPKTFQEINGVSMTNKFLDTFSFTKNLSYLLIDGFTVALQLVVGLIFISFFHPFFLVFAAIISFLIYIILKSWSNVAMKTSVSESTSKYNFINWLQELVRSNSITQSVRHKDFLFEKSEKLIQEYNQHRKNHFQAYISQIISLLVLFALTSAAIIGIGGFLVIQNQLSLGQLVAAEVIVTGILLNLAKSGRYLEVYYDLVASTYKLKELYETPIGDIQINQIDHNSEVSIKIDRVLAKLDQKEVLFNLQIPSLSRIYVQVENAPCKDILIDLLLQKQLPVRGNILVNQIDYQRLLPQEMKSLIYAVRDPAAIEGTIRENLTMGNTEISDAQIHYLLDLFELDETISSLKMGLDSMVQHHGYPFWKNKLIRIDLIRGILSKPKIIILTETFRLLDHDLQAKILEYLTNEKRTWSLINFASIEIKNRVIYDRFYRLNWKGFYE